MSPKRGGAPSDLRRRSTRRISVLLVGGWVVALAPGVRTAPSPAPKALIDQYCVSCHNQKLHTAGLDLEALSILAPGANAEAWEKVIARLRARLDAAARAAAPGCRDVSRGGWPPSSRTSIARGRLHPNPGRIGAVHRLNRAEYSNAVRDLFGIDPLSLDVKSLLPGDETADGSFDNFADALLDLDGPSGTHTCRSPVR